VSTASALLHAAAGGPGGASAAPDPAARLVLLLPAGPSDRVVCRPGEPAHILPGGAEPELAAGEALVAVDLEGRADADALERGTAARAGLAVALLALGAPRLAAHDGDDLARLVPEYVTLPRGVRLDAPEDGVQVTGGAA
jgi:hypothetical protein